MYLPKICNQKKNKSTAYGIRTRATAVKGRRPKPLDERGIKSVKKGFRGDGRNRTAVGGFADLCLTTRPRRLKVFLYARQDSNL